MSASAGPSRTSPTPAQLGKSVSKACDRCRKRKARCDEHIPCNGCVQAKTACEHTTPILKRGPRKKNPSSHLDDRIRNLEGLISSIASSNSTGLAGLSADELQQVRVAAHASPTSTGVSPQDGMQSILGAGWGMDMPALGEAGPSYPPPIMGQSGWLPQVPNQLPPTQLQGQLGAMLPAQAGGQAVAYGDKDRRQSVPPSTPRDLRYRDIQGQIKWLGPSSGMPLLDHLKPDTSSGPPIPSLPQEWISASTAPGSGVKEELEIQPDGDGGALWAAMTSLCPQDLLDALVHGYFTVTHLTSPILHISSFTQDYHSPSSRCQPTFVALVLSMCYLSSRFVADRRLSLVNQNGVTLAAQLALLAQQTVSSVAAQNSDLQIVQALMNMSVAQEGADRPSVLWAYIGQGIITAMEIGLHRRVDEWDEFDPVLVETRKRTMWSLYIQQVKVGGTFGRPLLLHLKDIDLDEPLISEPDTYATYGPPEVSYGHDPDDQVCILAGFVAALRIHLVLERIITHVNSSSRPTPQGFLSLVSVPAPQTSLTEELSLLIRVTEGLPGDWSFSADSIVDPSDVRFFQKTRVFALSHFARLLMVRHEFSRLLQGPDASSEVEVQRTARQVTESALAIVGTYFMVDNSGRLMLFGANAIAQLTQAGAGLISVILYARTSTLPGVEDLSFQASQGLPMALQVLRQLGKKRIAGARAAELLAEFSRTCRIPIFAGTEPELSNPSSTSSDPVDIPMLRSLRRRGNDPPSTGDQAQMQLQDFGDWLNFSMEGFTGWDGLADGLSG